MIEARAKASASAQIWASKRCPILWSEAYRPDIIYKKLESQATDFINDPIKGVSVDFQEKRIGLSMMYKWFGGDFKKGPVNTEFFNDRTEKPKAVLNFVLKYTSCEDKKFFLKKNRFLEPH